MYDGLGAIIVAPVRELAIQIFEVLNSFAEQHNFSAGLVIGGKDYKVERKHINKMNVLVATPGRLLQHMEESPGFNSDNVKMLVLDEVDMLLELGFVSMVKAIIGNLNRRH